MPARRAEAGMPTTRPDVRMMKTLKTQDTQTLPLLPSTRGVNYPPPGQATHYWQTIFLPTLASNFKALLNATYALCGIFPLFGPFLSGPGEALGAMDSCHK